MTSPNWPRALSVVLIGRLLRLLILTIALTETLAAQVPQIINFQGRVAVGSTLFNGSGRFKFAIVNATGNVTHWSNDGTSVNGSEPTGFVTLNVSTGLYSVLLGDTTISGMTAIPSTVFAQSDVRLRVWFNDGTTGSERLVPDQRIAAVGYAMVAATVADAAITATKIAPGAAAANLAADFGAVGDGVANDTQKFQDAANAQKPAALQMARRYKVTSTITNVGDFVLYGPPGGADRDSKNNTTPSSRHVIIEWAGPNNVPVIELNAELARTILIQNITFLVPDSYASQVIRIKGYRWYTGVVECPAITLKDLGFFRPMSTLNSGSSTSEAMRFNLDAGDAPRAFFNVNVADIYAYGFNSIVRVNCANEPGGFGNWFNGNSIERVSGFHCYRGLYLKAGTDGVSTINNNLFSFVQVQPGADNLGIHANGVFYLESNVTQNTFVSCTPYDVLPPGATWRHVNTPSNPAASNVFVNCPGVDTVTTLRATVFNPATAMVNGLTFPTPPAPSATSTTLDDYREGTFQPVIKFGGSNSGLTYGTRSGNFTRIGNRVLFDLVVTISNKGSSIGGMTLEGLPVRVDPASDGRALALGFASGTGSFHEPCIELIGGSSTGALRKKTAAGSGSNQNITEADINNGITLRISGQYMGVVE